LRCAYGFVAGVSSVAQPDKEVGPMKTRCKVTLSAYQYRLEVEASGILTGPWLTR
jgi:hypothetical protein